MSYSFSVKGGVAFSGDIQLSTPVAGYTGLVAEFSDFADFRTIDLTKSVTGTGHSVTLSLTAGEVDSLQDSYYRVRGTSGGVTSTLQDGRVRYVPASNSTGSININDPALKAAIGWSRPPAPNGMQLTFPRQEAGGSFTLVSGQMILTFFTALYDQNVTQLRTQTRGTAGAGLTIARMGLYSVSGSNEDQLTLLAGTPNDPAMWGNTFSSHLRSLSKTVAVSAGTRYAFGALAVGTTMPALYASQGLPLAEFVPRLSGIVSGLSDLPTSTTAGAGATGVFGALL